MKNEPLIIKKRGEDGSRVITVRIKEDLTKKTNRKSQPEERKIIRK